MKKMIALIVLTTLSFAACKSKEEKLAEEKEKKEKKVSKRDYSINVNNSFNDIFFDSSLVETFISENTIDEEMARRMRSFYNTRNYQFAWFSSSGLTEPTWGFWTLQNYSGDTSLKSKQLEKRMDNLMIDDKIKVNSSDKSIIHTELRLTETFIRFTLSNYEKGYVKRKEMERFVPARKSDPVYLADSVINKKHKDEKYFSDVNESYGLLKEELEKYLTIVNSGGWPELPTDPKIFKAGSASPEISNMKRLLFLTGDLSSRDTTPLFDEPLKNAIKNFQKRFGSKADGLINTALLKEMNVPAVARLKQILVNMNRMRWMPQEPEGLLILVNIPEFMLHIYDGKKEVMNMVVVVGKSGHNTTIFSDKLTTIVFSPYWNLPESIVKSEILPAMQKNENYLASHNMEITGGTDALPEIRQKPGNDNSLGKVKFLFPNSFNIYFHDTPAKGLFGRDVRAFSHGCIRLSEPQKLAEFLLKDKKKWTSSTINEAMNNGTEKVVSVDDPVPVFITYYTAWVDKNHQLNFRSDIYGHDKEMENKMFTGTSGVSQKVTVLK